MPRPQPWLGTSLIPAIAMLMSCAAAWAFTPARAPATELAAFVDYMKSRGVELRAVETRSNVIGHMFSVGPEHAKQYIVGLSWYSPPLTALEVFHRAPIAIPYVVNGRWVLWRTGGPGGNARPDYLPVWEKTQAAFAAYPDK